MLAYHSQIPICKVQGGTMKALTLTLGLLFLLGTTYVQASENPDQDFSITESEDIKYWVIEK
jgi:hypothetical protein